MTSETLPGTQALETASLRLHGALRDSPWSYSADVKCHRKRVRDVLLVQLAARILVDPAVLEREAVWSGSAHCLTLDSCQ